MFLFYKEHKNKLNAFVISKQSLNESKKINTGIGTINFDTTQYIIIF